MTKYQIAKAIDEVATDLHKDVWSMYRMMTIHYDYFTKSELQETLDRLIIERDGEPF